MIFIYWKVTPIIILSNYACFSNLLNLIRSSYYAIVYKLRRVSYLCEFDKCIPFLLYFGDFALDIVPLVI